MPPRGREGDGPVGVVAPVLMRVCAKGWAIKFGADFRPRIDGRG
jgi:hypothetical protein